MYFYNFWKINKFLFICLCLNFIVKAEEITDEEYDSLHMLKTKLFNGKYFGNEEVSKYAQEWVKNTPNAVLINWLQFYDYDDEKIKENLQNTLEWRMKNDIDNIQDWNPPKWIDENIQHTLTGYTTEENYPVIYLPIGNWKIREAVSLGLRADIIKNTVRILEKALKNANEQESKGENGIGKMLVITNWENFSLSELTSVRALSLMGTVASILQKHYPLSGAKVYLLNTPTYFKPALEVLKNVLNSKSLDTVESHNVGEKEAWMTEFKNKWPSKVIPHNLGGDYVL